MKREAVETAAKAEVAVVAEVIDTKIAEILKLHDEIRSSFKMTVEKAIRIGELLTGQKASLEHGGWLRWIKEYLPFSQQTVSNYMRCYEYRARLPSVGNLKDAYMLIGSLEIDMVPRKKPKAAEIEAITAKADRAEMTTPAQATRGLKIESAVDRHAEMTTPGQATKGLKIESAARNGVTDDDIKGEPSAEEVLAMLLRDVKRDVEHILEECDAFTEAYGEIDGSIFRQFTALELDEVKELVRYFGLLEERMAIIKQSISGKKGKKDKKEGFFRSRIGGGSRNRKAQ